MQRKANEAAEQLLDDGGSGQKSRDHGEGRVHKKAGLGYKTSRVPGPLCEPLLNEEDLERLAHLCIEE